MQKYHITNIGIDISELHNYPVGTKLIIVDNSRKALDMTIKQFDGPSIVCISDYSNNQEIVLTGKYLRKIIVVVESAYATILAKHIKNIEDCRKSLVKAYTSNNFCDNATMRVDIESMTRMLCVHAFDTAI